MDGGRCSPTPRGLLFNNQLIICVFHFSHLLFFTTTNQLVICCFHSFTSLLCRNNNQPTSNLLLSFFRLLPFFDLWMGVDVARPPGGFYLMLVTMVTNKPASRIPIPSAMMSGQLIVSPNPITMMPAFNPIIFFIFTISFL
nr:MAG TPA: hypothetical protein [Caudoviricetes sp.]